MGMDDLFRRAGAIGLVLSFAQVPTGLRENRRPGGKFPIVDELLSWRQLHAGFLRRLASSWLPCSLLALLAFLPLAGLTLLSPEQKDGPEWQQFVAGGLLFSRFLTPLAACLIVAYLARQDGKLDKTVSLWRGGVANYLPSVGLVLAVWFFAAFATLFFVIPGLGFLLGSSVALCVLVIEQTSVPEAVRRSWERTRYVRHSLLVFWVVYAALALALVSLVVLLSTRDHPAELLCRPLAESPALLPLVLTWSFLYGAAICASYEIYRQLDRLDFESPPAVAKVS
jgi:hypothetical protein